MKKLKFCIVTWLPLNGATWKPDIRQIFCVPKGLSEWMCKLHLRRRDRISASGVSGEHPVICHGKAWDM
eukprot:7220636-Prorocentrum_lima.AAC.1